MGKRRMPEERTPSLLTWWRARTADRSTRVEGRHLIRESRRILKKKSYRIPAGVAAQVQADIAAVEQALVGDDLEQLRKTIAALDDAHGRAPRLRAQVDRPRVLGVDRRRRGDRAAPARLRRRGLPDPVGLDDPDAGGRRSHLRLQVHLRAQHPVHRHQDPAVRRAQARRRHRLQVAQRPQHRLHQAGGRPAGRRHRDAGRRSSTSTASRSRASACRAPCDTTEAPRSGESSRPRRRATSSR